MSTIEAYRNEIHMQLGYLTDIGSGLPDTIPAADQSRCIFAGSGDSMAAAMLAEAFSHGRARAMDPTDIIRGGRLTDLGRVYLISISGNTIANIRVAGRTADSVAITARPDSRLASAARGLICVDFPHTETTTAGSISFLASALACISLTYGHDGLSHATHVFECAKKDADRITVSGSLYILGNMYTFPLAMYAAAKFYEVLGYDARYVRIEQFSHMELFSAHPGDTVLILEEPNSRTRMLVESMERVGIHAFAPASIPKEASGIAQMLYCTFLPQLLTLRLAEERGFEDCHFVTAHELRAASNAAIY